MSQTRPRFPNTPEWQELISFLKENDPAEMLDLLQRQQSVPLEPFANTDLTHKHPEFKKSTQKWIILGCVHRPFHNQILWHKIMKLISEIDLDGIILNGDFLDLFTLGSYNQDSLQLLRDIELTLDDEYRSGREGLADIEKALQGREVQKVFIYGNHEDRYFREVKKGDNAKYGGALISPHEALNLDKLKYKTLYNWQDDSFQLGNHLEVCHGYFTCVHTAKKHLDEYFGSVLFAHTHRIQSYGSGKHMAYSIGWLGDPNASVFKYMYRKARMLKWMNGFAIVNIDDNGYFWVEPKPCFNDSFIHNEKLY